MSKDLQKSPNQVLLEAAKKDVENITQYLDMLLPSREAVDRFKRMAHLAVLRDPGLLKCDLKSFLLALVWCAYRTLEPGVEDGAWLIPYKGKVVPVPAYKGIIKRAVETKTVIDVNAYLIYEDDEFDYGLGTAPYLTHHPRKFGLKRGEIIGAYVVFTMPDGTKRFAPPMDREEIEKVRDSSAAWKASPNSGPWHNWFDQQALKTVIKRGFKQIPVQAEVRDLLVDDGQMEAGGLVGTMLRQSDLQLPEGFLEEDEPPAGAKTTTKKQPVDTAPFDKFFQAKDLSPERQEHLKVYMASGTKSKGSEEAFKSYCMQDLEKTFEHFEGWEARHYPMGESEPGQDPESGEQGSDPEGGEPDPEPGKVTVLSDQRHAIWDLVIQKGIAPLELTAKTGVSSINDITVDNEASVKAFVDAYQPTKRGREK